MPYAVNLADLMVEGREAISGCLIAPVCPSRTPVDAEPGLADGAGLLLECEDKQAQAIVGVLRLKFELHEMRCYRRERGRWRRV